MKPSQQTKIIKIKDARIGGEASRLIAEPLATGARTKSVRALSGASASALKGGGTSDAYTPKNGKTATRRNPDSAAGSALSQSEHADKRKMTTEELTQRSFRIARDDYRRKAS